MLELAIEAIENEEMTLDEALDSYELMSFEIEILINRFEL